MQAKAMAKLPRVLSTSRRVEILTILLDAETPVASSTVASFLQIKDAHASYNLIKLSEVGLISRTPHGRHVFYSANRRLISEIQAFFDVKHESRQEEKTVNQSLKDQA